jgi:hypothetical protein
MKNNVKKPNPDPIVSDPALEAQMQNLADNPPAPTQTLAVQPDLRIEKVKANTKTGEREIVRSQSGKFAKSSTLAAALDAAASQKFLRETDPELGVTRKHAMREALYKAALKPTEKSLGSCVKVAEFFEKESGNTDAKESMLAEANKDIRTPINAIFITLPNLNDPTVHDFEKEVREKAERTAKGPSFAEVLDIRTDPVKV